MCKYRNFSSTNQLGVGGNCKRLLFEINHNRHIGHNRFFVIYVPIWLKIKTMITQKQINDLTYKIIGYAIEVHKELGPGLLESVYEKCLAHLLQLNGHE